MLSRQRHWWKFLKIVCCLATVAVAVGTMVVGVRVQHTRHHMETLRSSVAKLEAENERAAKVVGEVLTSKELIRRNVRKFTQKLADVGDTMWSRDVMVWRGVPGESGGELDAEKAARIFLAEELQLQFAEEDVEDVERLDGGAGAVRVRMFRRADAERIIRRAAELKSSTFDIRARLIGQQQSDEI